MKFEDLPEEEKEILRQERQIQAEVDAGSSTYRDAPPYQMDREVR